MKYGFEREIVLMGHHEQKVTAENIFRLKILVSKINFSETVGKSLDQSFVRSISTSMTVILVLLSLVFFGPSSTKYFALMLTAGMFFGTYSSIFLASPLLVWVEERQQKAHDKNKTKAKK